MRLQTRIRWGSSCESLKDGAIGSVDSVATEPQRKGALSTNRLSISVCVGWNVKARTDSAKNIMSHIVVYVYTTITVRKDIAGCLGRLFNRQCVHDVPCVAARSVDSCSAVTPM